ncbi:MAG: hypothetical protein DRN27_10135, partial [Thermoplasmata archaeon]
MDNTLLIQLEKKYPFLTVCRYADEEFVGIIQNHDNTITSIYDFGQLPTVELKKLFLDLGETWWWESNREIPINLFLKNEWTIFKPYTRIFTNKTLKILSGPVTSLNN